MESPQILFHILWCFKAKFYSFLLKKSSIKSNIKCKIIQYSLWINWMNVIYFHKQRNLCLKFKVEPLTDSPKWNRKRLLGTAVTDTKGNRLFYEKNHSTKYPNIRQTHFRNWIESIYLFQRSNSWTVSIDITKTPLYSIIVMRNVILHHSNRMNATKIWEITIRWIPLSVNHLTR